MKLLYRVHSVSLIHRDDVVTHRGKEVLAPVDCLEVELEHASEHSHGSLQLRFYGAEIVEAQQTFSQSFVDLSFVAADPTEAVAET